MTLEEVWENLRQDPEIKATMEEVDKSYKLFKKIENLIVADLEAKLAESEKTIEELKGKRLEFYIDDVRQTQVINGVHFDIEQLLVFSEYVEHIKQQLADKEQAIENWKTMYESVMQTCNNDAKEIDRLIEQLAEKDGELHQIYSHLGVEAFGEDIHEQALKEIAEKEKENFVLKAVIDKNKTGQFGAVNICNAISEFYEPLVRDMIIAELEKLLEKTQTLDVMVQSGHYINQKKVNVVFKDVIDQQIKSLKGEK